MRYSAFVLLLFLCVALSFPAAAAPLGTGVGPGLEPSEQLRPVKMEPRAVPALPGCNLTCPLDSGEYGCWRMGRCKRWNYRPAPPPPPRTLSQLLGWDRMCAASSAGLPAATGSGCAKHKPLLAQVLPIELLAAAAFFVVAALAMSGGIGGGAMFVPALALLLRFDAPVAARLSQSLIFGGSLGALAVNAPARHPKDPRRPLIDLGMTAFLAPSEMAGALIGGLLNPVLPPLLILGAMTLVLCLTAHATLRKGMRLWRQEREQSWSPAVIQQRSERKGLFWSATGALRKVNPLQRIMSSEELSGEAGAEGKPGYEGSGWASGVDESSAVGDDSVVNESGAEEAAETDAEIDAEIDDKASEERAARNPLTPRRVVTSSMSTPGSSAGGRFLYRGARTAGGGREGGPLVRGEIVLIVCTWLWLVLLLLLRGGKGSPSLMGIAPCSRSYWAVTLFALLSLLAASLYGGRLLVKKAAREGESDARLAGDVHWDIGRAATCMGQTVAAGMVAGLMGVGGGILLGPLMLHMGVLPEAPLDYSLAFGCVTCVGAFVGKRFVLHLVRAYRCSALIVLILGGLIAVSVVSVGATGALSFEKELERGHLFAALAMKPLCKK